MTQTSLTLQVQKALYGFKLDVNETLSLKGITAVFGPSGAGKSTLLKLIAGLDNADSGQISFGDKIWYDDKINIPAQKREAGYLFQSGALFSHLSVRDNLRFADKRSKHIQNGITMRGVIDLLDLAPLLTRKPATLSGGETQRAALGRLLLSRPKLLLLDEPMTGLDRAKKRELLPLIKSLPAQFNLPCLYVTHDVDEVTALADHILILKDGRVKAYGPAIEVLNQIDRLPLSDLNIDPGSVFDAKVSDIINDMMELKIGEAELSLPHQNNLRIGEYVRLKIRSQDVSLATTQPKNISIQNCLAGHITYITSISDTPFFDVTVSLGDDNTLKSRVTRQAIEGLKLGKGQNIFALIKTASLER